MKEYQRKFIELAIENEVLKFGEFTLKSGRKSPYFFNAGLFRTSKSIATLTNIYAEAIVDSLEDKQSLGFDVLFGPAYKGIPLATGVAIHLWEKFNFDIGVTYNRKEKKDHGEGGVLVGASLENQKVFAIDDVMTAGTAIRESISLIEAAGGNLNGVIVALDRQEKSGNGSVKSTIQQLEEEIGLKVLSIVKLDDIVEFISTKPEYSETLQLIKDYRSVWGA